MGCNSPGSTHYAACDCRESEWAARLAAAEEAYSTLATHAQEMEARAEKAEAAHGGCDAQVRTLVAKALAAVRGQEAAEKAEKERAK